MIDPQPPPNKIAIPATVWTLGFVSMFMDISSEIIHALLPLFLTTTLGLSVAVVGLLDGVAEATASIVKVFSGYISDRIGKRKPLILLGYGLGALSKPVFALAGTAPVIMGARFLDRIGKGLRGAPRDALVVDVTPPEIRGRAFGLRQTMDTIGAFIGPLIAVVAMIALSNNMRAVFWIAVIPAFIAVLLVAAFIKDADKPSRDGQAALPIRMKDIVYLPRAYWMVVAIAAVFTLARFSEAFLILKAHDEGLHLAFAPLVLVVMNGVYALCAYPLGVMSDRINAKMLLMFGLMILIASDAALAFLPRVGGVFVGIALWGVHMAATQGLFAKLIADQSPAHLRGSAYGVFNLVSGLALLVASVTAGLVWEHMGPTTTFVLGACFAACALAALVFMKQPMERPS